MADKKLTKVSKVSKDYRYGWEDGHDGCGMATFYDEPTDDYRRGYEAGRTARHRAKDADEVEPWEEEQRHRVWGKLDGVWRRPPDPRRSEPAYFEEYQKGLTLPAEPDPVPRYAKSK